MPARSPNKPSSYQQPSGEFGLSFVLACLAHVVLFVLLFFAVQWKSTEPTSVYAEIWNPEGDNTPFIEEKTPQENISPEPTPETEVEPEVKPEPEPEPAPEPVPEEPLPEAKPAAPITVSPKIAEQQTIIEDPDIVMEQIRREKEQKRLEELRLAEEKRLAEQRRLEEEQRIEKQKQQAEEEKRKAEEEQRKLEEARREQEQRQLEELRLKEELRKAEELRLAEERRLEQERIVAEQKRKAEEKSQQEAIERQKQAELLKQQAEERERQIQERRRLQEQEEKKKEELRQQVAAQRKAEAAQRAKEEKEAVARRQALLGRLTSRSGGSPSGNSTATMTGAQQAQYTNMIVACVRPHIVFSVPEYIKRGQNKAEFVVTLLQGGQQTGSPKLAKSSGLAAFDAAVERAIRKCNPFPKPPIGATPKTINLTFDPVDDVIK